MVLSEIFYEGQLYVKIQDLTQRPRIEMQGLGFKAFPGNLTPFSRENQEKKKKKDTITPGAYYTCMRPTVILLYCFTVLSRHLLYLSQITAGQASAPCSSQKHCASV